jgi:septal ring factor EnvC (AmiA/AmiB activator)
MNLPDRNEIETALTGIRAEIAEHRRQLDGLVSNRRHMYRQESVLRGLQGTDRETENVGQQLAETLAELDRYDAEIDTVDDRLENLEAEALQHIEALETWRRVPGIVRDLSVLWACRASRGRLAPSLPSYAGGLIEEQLQAAGREFQAGEKDLDAVTSRLKRSYRI